MNLKSRLKSITALAITGLAIASMASGCSDAKALQDAACCTAFQVGTDMTWASASAGFRRPRGPARSAL